MAGALALGGCVAEEGHAACCYASLCQSTTASSRLNTTQTNTPSPPPNPKTQQHRHPQVSTPKGSPSSSPKHPSKPSGSAPAKSSRLASSTAQPLADVQEEAGATAASSSAAPSPAAAAAAAGGVTHPGQRAVAATSSNRQPQSQVGRESFSFRGGDAAAQAASSPDPSGALPKLTQRPPAATSSAAAAAAGRGNGGLDSAGERVGGASSSPTFVGNISFGERQQQQSTAGDGGAPSGGSRSEQAQAAALGRQPTLAMGMVGGAAPEQARVVKRFPSVSRGEAGAELGAAATTAAAAAEAESDLPPSPFETALAAEGANAAAPPVAAAPSSSSAAVPSSSSSAAAAAVQHPRVQLAPPGAAAQPPSRPQPSGGSGSGSARPPGLQRTPSAPASAFRRGVSFLSGGAFGAANAPAAAAGSADGWRARSSSMELDESFFGFDDAASDDEDGGSGNGEANVAAAAAATKKTPEWRQLLMTLTERTNSAINSRTNSASAAAIELQQPPPGLHHARSRHLSFITPASSAPGAAGALKGRGERLRPRGAAAGGDGAGGWRQQPAGMYGLLSALKDSMDGTDDDEEVAAVAAAATNKANKEAAGAEGRDGGAGPDGAVAAGSAALRAQVARIPSIPRLPPLPQKSLSLERQRQIFDAAAAASQPPQPLPSASERVARYSSVSGEAALAAAGLSGLPPVRLGSGKDRGPSGHSSSNPGSLGGDAQGVLRGGLPLEALTRMQPSYRLSKNNSFMLQALSSQASQQVQQRVWLGVQVHAMGTWSFKGIAGEHSVVQLLPSQLAARLYLSDNKVRVGVGFARVGGLVGVARIAFDAGIGAGAWG